MLKTKRFNFTFENNILDIVLEYLYNLCHVLHIYFDHHLTIFNILKFALLLLENIIV